MNNMFLITIGDIKGIGIELLIKFFKLNYKYKFILVTNKIIILNYLKKNGIKIKINELNHSNYLDGYIKNKINIFNFKAKNIYENSYKSIIESYKFCLKNKCIGIITLPINKYKIIKNIDKNFIGHTELFEKIEKNTNSNMIFVHKKLIISSLTTHKKLSKIPIIIKNKTLIYNKILALNKTLIRDFKIKKPKIMISGINPHAGENGKIGLEEELYIKPLIKKAKKNKIQIYGPISGDAMINKKNIINYDCFLFIYHDQALIPFKLLSNYEGINFTSNLKVIRLSPDHGTAEDIVGKNIATVKSLVNCFKIGKQIYRNRKSN